MSTVLHLPSIADLHNDPEGRLCELVRGELVEKVMAFESIWVVSQIVMLLKVFAEKRKLGWVLAEQPVACFPWIERHARRPDVIFVSLSKVPSARTHIAALKVPPDLCVEVLSPDDDVIELETKIAEYLQAGVPLVWIVNPALKTLRVHRLNGTISQYASTDTVTGEDILPDFSVQVAEFFPPE